MTDERFAEFVKTALDDLDPVPPTPRAELWARIQAERSRAKQVQPTRTYRTWINWSAGLAAMLTIGVGLGRFSATRNLPAPRHVAGSPVPANQAAYHLVVSQYMSSAEALLTSYRTQPQGTIDPEIAQWAADMLTNTRMLMDSPAAADPKTVALLQDLELMFAQIARMSAPSKLEREIIQDGINKTAVLPRIRAAQPATVGT